MVTSVAPSPASWERPPLKARPKQREIETIRCFAKWNGHWHLRDSLKIGTLTNYSSWAGPLVSGLTLYRHRRGIFGCVLVPPLRSLVDSRVVKRSANVDDQSLWTRMRMARTIIMTQTMDLTDLLRKLGRLPPDR